jgi:hypothetical protein
MPDPPSSCLCLCVLLNGVGEVFAARVGVAGPQIAIE